VGPQDLDGVLIIPKTIFDRTQKKRQRVDPKTLETLEKTASYDRTAAVESLQTIREVTRHARRGHWAQAIKALRPFLREWRRDEKGVGGKAQNLMVWLDEAAYDDTGKYAKSVLELLGKLERAFEVGYPSQEGAKVLGVRW